MRRVWRWGPWLLLGAVAAVVLVIGSQRTSHLTTDAETMHIAAEVRCPVCEGQSAAQSNAPASLQIRDQIHQELTAGEPSGQILSGLVAAYGTGILEKPQASGIGLVVWVVPVVAAAAAVTGLFLAFKRWHPRSTPSISAEDRALVERALDGPATRGGSRSGPEAT